MKNAPARVRVLRGDEELRIIAVANIKRRHLKTLECLRDLQWTKLELLAKNGDVLDVVEHPDHADIEAGDDAGDQVDGRDRWILKLLIEAQRAVMTYKSAEATEALNACVKVMNVVTTMVVDAIQTMSKLHAMQLQAAQSFGGVAGAEETPQSQKLLESMAPMLLQKLAPMLMGGAPPPVVQVAAAAKPNGTPAP